MTARTRQLSDPLVIASIIAGVLFLLVVLCSIIIRETRRRP
jgi:hypothetical protein